jgi:TolB protein
LTLATPSLAQDSIPADEIWIRLVATSGSKRLSLVLAPFDTIGELHPDLVTNLEGIRSVLEADLEFSLHFILQEPDSGVRFDYETDPARIDLGQWASTGAEILLCADMKAKPSGPVLEVRLYDLESNRRIATKPYPHRAGWRWLAHEVADDVIQLLTGKEGVSRTRLAFARRLDPDRKEIALVDYDGAGLKQLTESGGIKLFPDWSPDGSRIAYCAYGPVSLTIYSLDVAQRTRTAVSERPGLNTTPAWSPDGRTIVASLSHSGQSDIYTMNVDGKQLRRLTTNRGIDISPAWSPDGRQVAFVSDRTGAPQVYVMGVDGTDLRRVTFEGNYNTSPAWSPHGDLIAFVQRQPNGSNQVCVTNILGDTYIRLTSRGNNEDPCWSPDGLHLAFASTRAGGPDLYVMDWNGANQRRVTRIGGAYSPDWSPVLR